MPGPSSRAGNAWFSGLNTGHRGNDTSGCDRGRRVERCGLRPCIAGFYQERGGKWGSSLERDSGLPGWTVLGSQMALDERWCKVCGDATRPPRLARLSGDLAVPGVVGCGATAGTGVPAVAPNYPHRAGGVPGGARAPARPRGGRGSARFPSQGNRPLPRGWYRAPGDHGGRGFRCGDVRCGRRRPGWFPGVLAVRGERRCDLAGCPGRLRGWAAGPARPRTRRSCTARRSSTPTCGLAP